VNKLDEVFSVSRSARDYARGYCAHLSDLLGRLDYEAVDKVAGLFEQARQDGRTIFFLGNGGSAATASHFVCDLGKGTKTGSRPFKAVGFADNVATMTAYANDEAYERVFSRQLENFLEAGDLVVCISASGNSPNLIQALKLARERQAVTISLLGFDGGAMKALSDHVVLVATAKGEYGPVEDIHMILDHIITTYLYRKLTNAS